MVGKVCPESKAHYSGYAMACPKFQTLYCGDECGLERINIAYFGGIVISDFIKKQPFNNVFSGFKLFVDNLFGVEKSKYRSEERRVGKECRSRWSPYQ